MTYRLEVDIAFNVRARKGERREAKTGRLIKCSIYLGTKAECLGDSKAAQAAGERLAPGHSEVIAVRGYVYADYKIDPLKAIPEYTAANL